MEDGRKAHLVITGWLCTTLCLVSYTAAFSHGASLSACADMMPKHLRAQLHSPRNNYVTIHTNMSFYFPGGKVPGEKPLLILCLSQTFPVMGRKHKAVINSSWWQFTDFQIISICDSKPCVLSFLLCAPDSEEQLFKKLPCV